MTPEPGPPLNGHVRPAGVLPGDHRTADDVEAGIVSLWRQYGDQRAQVQRAQADRAEAHRLSQAEPAQGTPTQGEPAQRESAQRESAQREPAQKEPAQAKPTRGTKTRTVLEPADVALGVPNRGDDVRAVSDQGVAGSGEVDLEGKGFEQRAQELRDRLVLHYAPLVKYVAGRVGTGLPAHVDVSDLIQSGIFGLVDAIEKFEPERGLKFETYAMQRIRGAILDDLRAQDWVPRTVRGRAREIERAMERLGGKLQRTPTDAELADELGLSLQELRDVYAQLQLTSVIALDELAAAGRGTTSLADILEDERADDPVATLVDQDNRRQLAAAIGKLAERDRIVVTLYYFENLTLAEIGRVLGVTESRVCQLHTRAVLRLRAKLMETVDV
jgi:RNA polymerase sigma factor for flagellar operon FliA